MRNFIGAAACAALLATSCGAFAQQADDSALVARGDYLARAADCMPCHTAQNGTPYAGGLALNTPFGAIYSPNITSDPIAGIGTWTFTDFKAALHDGIRKDGAYLYPAMPFDAYTGITGDDLKALWAYVRRIPAATRANTPNALGFPFNVRLGLLAWRELFFEPATFTPTPGKSEVWNRGAYLVEALGHCADCHTPRNIMGAVKGKENFLGYEVDGFWAPDIAAANLAKRGWTSESLAQFLKTGSAPGKTSVFGPMAEVVRDSLAYLTDADRAAMVTYLLDSPPPKDRPAPQAASPLPADVYKRGAALYVDNCAPCHQAKGVGQGVAIPPLAGNPVVVAGEPYDVLMAILGGVPAGGTYGAMPSFAGRLADQQVADLANYVRTSWGNGAPANVTAAMVAAWRATAHVPDYATQAASAFDCPQVGGAPGASGPDPKAVAALTAMMQGGQRSVSLIVDAYKAADSGASEGTIVDAVTAAYCPVVAKGDAPVWQKYAELRRFTLQAAAELTRQRGAITGPENPVIWAVSAGTSLVAREPVSSGTAFACPANVEGKAVPAPLAAAAATALGDAKVPVSGDAASKLATTLAAANPKAKLADVANGLILAYCAKVAPLAGTPGVGPADQQTFMNAFGLQVIQALQLLPPPKAVAAR